MEPAIRTIDINSTTTKRRGMGSAVGEVEEAMEGVAVTTLRAMEGTQTFEGPIGEEVMLTLTLTIPLLVPAPM